MSVPQEDPEVRRLRERAERARRDADDAAAHADALAALPSILVRPMPGAGMSWAQRYVWGGGFALAVLVACVVLLAQGASWPAAVVGAVALGVLAWHVHGAVRFWRAPLRAFPAVVRHPPRTVEEDRQFVHLLSGDLVAGRRAHVHLVTKEGLLQLVADDDVARAARPGEAGVAHARAGALVAFEPRRTIASVRAVAQRQLREEIEARLPPPDAVDPPYRGRALRAVAAEAARQGLLRRAPRFPAVSVENVVLTAVLSVLGVVLLVVAVRALLSESARELTWILGPIALGTCARAAHEILRLRAVRRAPLVVEAAAVDIEWYVERRRTRHGTRDVEVMRVFVTREGREREEVRFPPALFTELPLRGFGVAFLRHDVLVDFARVRIAGITEGRLLPLDGDAA